MNDCLHAIPTEYGGVCFRSRLEARWAAFFDLVGWQWEYEPSIDFPGWIPDFRLKGAQPAFVEIKPIDLGIEEPTVERTRDAVPKIFAAADWFALNGPEEHTCGEFPFNHEILLLGLGPFSTTSCMSEWALGVFIYSDWNAGFDVALLHGGIPPQKLDYAGFWGSFRYRMNGVHDGDHHLRACNRFDAPDRLWRAAGNLTQWRAS